MPALADPRLSMELVALVTVAAWVGAGVGVMLGQKTRLHLRAFLAAGVFALLYVVLFDVLPSAKPFLSWWLFLVAVGSGAAVMAVIAKYVGPPCPACAHGESHECEEAAIGIQGILAAIGLGIHCVLDGLGFVVNEALTAKLDLPYLAGLAIHKLPEGFALAVLLLAAGISRSRALAYAIAAESLTLVGGAVGCQLGAIQSPIILAFVTAHVGGGFIFLIFGPIRDQIASMKPIDVAVH